MNNLRTREGFRIVGGTLAIAIGSLLVTSCASQDVLAQDQACVDSVSLTPDQLNQLPGESMRRDLNQSALFRAATVNIVFANGYGSGGLFRNKDGQLVVRTVRHVLEPATAAPYGGIYFPGYGWWDIAGCELEDVSVGQVGDADYRGDSISEIVVSDEVAAELEYVIASGGIQPIEDYSDVSADYLIDSGYVARIADAETGTYTSLPFTPDAEALSDDLLQLISPANTGNGGICQGRSGQPVQMGFAGDTSISDQSFGAVSFTSGPDLYYRDSNGRVCSTSVGVIKSK